MIDTTLNTGDNIVTKMDRVWNSWSSGSHEGNSYQSHSEDKVATVISTMKGKPWVSVRDCTHSWSSHPIGRLKELPWAKKDWTKIWGMKSCQWVAGVPGKGYSAPSGGKKQTKRRGMVRPDGAVTEGFCISWACFKSTKITRSDFNLYIKNLQMMKTRKNHLLEVKEEKVFRKRISKTICCCLVQAGQRWSITVVSLLTV